MKLIESLKQEWFKRNEIRLQAEFNPALIKLESSLNSRRLELESARKALETRGQEEILTLEKRVEDRKLELARCNEDLKQQIRLIEAKASPDNVWTEAFSAGFMKAWDCIWPLLQEGVSKSKEFIRNQAIDEARSNIEGAVLSRLDQADKAHLKPVVAIQTEIARLRGNIQRDPSTRDTIKALEWVLQKDNR